MGRDETWPAGRAPNTEHQASIFEPPPPSPASLPTISSDVCVHPFLPSFPLRGFCFSPVLCCTLTRTPRSSTGVCQRRRRSSSSSSLRAHVAAGLHNNNNNAGEGKELQSAVRCGTVRCGVGRGGGGKAGVPSEEDYKLMRALASSPPPTSAKAAMHSPSSYKTTCTFFPRSFQ